MSVLGETPRGIGRPVDLECASYEKAETTPYARMMREITWQHVRRFLPRRRDARVLDAGGSGYWTVRLARAGFTLVCLESSQERLSAARERVEAAGIAARVELAGGQLTDLREFAEGAFDATLALGEPASFAGDPEMAVAEMAL